MFEQLFGSKTRVKLLQLFFENPNRSFYVREITRKIEEQINYLFLYLLAKIQEFVMAHRRSW